VTETIRLPDGTGTWLREWPATATAPRRGSLLIVHGLGEHSGRYEHVGGHLAGLGLATTAYDLRGHGRSEGARGSVPHEDALLDDLEFVYAIAARRAAAAGDARPPLLLGHSLGGALAALAVTAGRVEPRALVLSSPALRLRVSRGQAALAAVTRRLAPDRQFPNDLPVDRLSHDPAVPAAYRADPLVHDRITPRLLRFLSGAGDAVRRDAGTIAVPTLLLASGRDALVDAAGARELADRLAAGIATVHVYDDLEHELFNEAEPARARVFADLDTWLEPLLSAP
jgi:alpha-beta hydrolase superfamily lysophospholipase